MSRRLLPRKVIAFDLDGTLLDALPDIARAANEALLRFNPSLAPFQEHEVRRMVGDGGQVLVGRMLQAREVHDTSAVHASYKFFLEEYGIYVVVI
jgi:phosphoglycolate phosphatase